MRRFKNRSLGFTMAEVLIVVAIIAVLSGVSVVAVQNYQRSTAQLERDSIAKELFVAAQNHLTMAESQGFLGVTDFGTLDESNEKETNTYYFIVNGRTSFQGDSVLDLMLPFGSIDETVRVGGSYVIRYQKSPALVRDVFYSEPNSQRFKHTVIPEEYTDLLNKRDTVDSDGNIVSHKNERRNYGTDKCVIGWYGGLEGLETGTRILPPRIEVINGEKLLVKLYDKNAGEDGYALKLIISGVSSNTDHAIEVTMIPDRVLGPEIKEDEKVYSVVLDDITSASRHFADFINEGRNFVPGEDITVSAVAFNKTKLTNIAYSSAITTNSLFADMQQGVGDDDGATAYIANFRHLENLAPAISNLEFDYKESMEIRDEDASLNVKKAIQIADLAAPVAEASNETDETNPDPDEEVQETEGELGGDDDAPAAAADLSWTGFLSVTESNKIYGIDFDITGYYPVTPKDGLIEYDGQHHSIEGVVVDGAVNAGLFGTLSGGSVKNLELIDFTVSAVKDDDGNGGNAGALAGTTTGTTVENVVAHKSALKASDKTSVNVTGAAAAGGLIGAVSGGKGAVSDGKIDLSAASLIVKGTDAGGLIGKASNGALVGGCYSGGHTDGTAQYSSEDINVTGTAAAGGLIGDAGDADIDGCYSTCSVKGETAGGLVGSAEGDLDDCYCTGLVVGASDDAKVGAFAGKLTGTPTDCQFFEIINEGMSALGPDSAAGLTVAELDESLTTYKSFVGAPTDWQGAKVYDPTLTTYYGQDKFSLKTVAQLFEKTAGEQEYVGTHYGDWPAPEIFIFNEKQSSGGGSGEENTTDENE